MMLILSTQKLCDTWECSLVRQNLSFCHCLFRFRFDNITASSKLRQQNIENDDEDNNNDANDSNMKENFLEFKFESHRQAQSQGPKLILLNNMIN
ncbi:unnamed protein product [Rotaria sp. Silwood2]|nr:unnamed protein product [Rotaria sp. Silwood2]